MSGRYRGGLLVALVVQLALLGWMVVDRALLLANGREVRLAMMPIDPRDMFRGDYVILNYAISRIHNGRVTVADDINWNDIVYVSLAEADGTWGATTVSKEPPPEGVFIRGTVTYTNELEAETDDTCPPVIGCRTYDIEYGIERFYVPEGTGREIEDIRGENRVTVDAVLADNGQAALKRLLVDGKVRFDEPFY